MNNRSLQKKRRAASNDGLMILHSKTRRRKRQHVAAGAAAADLGSEVPNLGVARALFVILLLHLGAIAAIFIHNKVTNDDPVVLKSPVMEAPKAAVAAASLPKVQQGEDYYFVATGDTYDRIARVKNVDVMALREINNNVALRAGRILRMPPGARVPAAARVPAGAPLARREAPEEAPAIRPVDPAPAEDRPRTVASQQTAAPRAVLVEEQIPVRVQVARPVHVTPRLNLEDAARAIPVTEDSGKVYTVKAGDTVWGIASRHKISRQSLLELNGISDPRKMRSGMTLKIPSRN